ncbi:tetratricopeptide repeat protein [Chondromyces apiculatus]|uniref:Uncharacterized protein n=1 Tax=Chondromyces apiculatus DSM 436 TaxID=1192034 RepID=A0A017T0D6_9BACT|nr:hypothetical protein [Chondromyces apiculatus]EYF02462.1 Hypothetical protein CAP_7084 [Chondromyces apiculatus DSM 436]
MGAQREPGFAGREVYAQIIEILERAVMLESAVPAQQRKSVLVQGYVEMGVCHEHLGDTERALHAYSEALNVDADNDAALTARGRLRVARAEDALAMQDFERAVARGTPLIWPYLHLAFHALNTAEYERCLELCRTGLERTEDERLRAALYEWMVVSVVMLGSPPPLVEDLLERALDLAPFNARIPRYRERYDQHAAVDVAQIPWELTDEAANDNARREIVQRVAMQRAA